MPMGQTISFMGQKHNVAARNQPETQALIGVFPLLSEATVTVKLLNLLQLNKILQLLTAV